MHVTAIELDRMFDKEDPNRTAVLITPNNRTFDNYLQRKADISILKHFVEIESARYGRTNKHVYIVIQFKDASAATNLISRRSVFVVGTAFIVVPFYSNKKLKKTVKRMTFTHLPYYAPPAPDRSEDNIYNVLNDDCLEEICRRMDRPSDRFEIEKVCKRFKQVAETAFLAVYKKTDYITFRKLNPDGNVSVTEIQKFLRRYGPSLGSVHLYEGSYQHIPDRLNSILKLMNEHCPNLKGLSFYLNNEIESQTLIEIRPLLSKLKELSISHKLLSVCNTFVTACKEIEKLTIRVDDIDEDLPNIRFSKLKSLYVNRETIGVGALERFLKQNCQLEKLEIPYELGILRLVAEAVPNLRQITLNGLIESVSNNDVLHLKSLKHAKIFMSCRSEQTMSESFKSIHKVQNITNLTVVLDFFDVTSVIGLTKHLCNLETLKINVWSEEKEPILSTNQLKEILQHAKKLRKLDMIAAHIHHYREKDYDEILQIVKNRSNHPLKLNIYLGSNNHGQLFVYRDRSKKTTFLNADPQWLTIVNYYIILLFNTPS